MKYIIRKKSIATGKKNLEKLFNIQKFPVFIGAINNPLKNDKFAEFALAICKDSGFVQLTKLVPPDIVYSGYHSEALGKVWKAHHKQFANLIRKYKASEILEIGGSNGALAKLVINANYKSWTIVEPNPAVVRHKKIKIIKKLFDKNLIINKKYDLVVHSHTLEHALNPLEFLHKVNDVMENNSLQIFSIPNLYKYLINKQSNVINFEHTFFLSEEFTDSFLKMTGFKIIKKQYFGEHSIFYVTKKISLPANKFQGKNLYSKYKMLFQKYLMYYENLVYRYNKKIKKLDGAVYLFGAHVFSQFLIAIGLNNNVVGILDNSDMKQGKRLYGTSLKIESPHVIKGIKNVTVILNAGQYQSEIKTQLKSINPKVVILEK